jgi:hypothetical protein
MATQKLISNIFQINQPTKYKNFSSLLLNVYSYVQLNIFWGSSRPSSGTQQLQKQPLVLPLERGGSSPVGHGWAGCIWLVDSFEMYDNARTCKF